MRTLAENALLYHDLGFSTIPLKPNTKRPAISSWKEYQHHRPNRRQVKDWFSDDDLGIGIITGQVSDLLVIDIDNPKGHGWLVRQGGIDTTPWVKTVRGWHVYMRYPEGVNFTKVTPINGLEIMGNGHYVVAPPSKHPSGKRYEWIFHPNKVALAELRPWIEKAIKRGLRGGFQRQKRERTATVSELRHSDLAIPPKRKKAIPKITPAPNKEGLKKQIFSHHIWEGHPKQGSNNGLFLTRLITHFRTGSDQEEAISEVNEWAGSQVPYPKIRAASQVTWRRGYGLKPQVIEQVSELNYEESYAFVNLVAQYDGWDTHQSKQKQLPQEIVTQRIIAVTWFYNFRFTTIGQLAKAASMPYRTLYNRIREDRLPSYIKILTIPRKGILVINLLPFILHILFKQTPNQGTFPTTSRGSVTNPLSSSDDIERGSVTNPLSSSDDIDDVGLPGGRSGVPDT